MIVRNIIVAGDSIARGYADPDGLHSWPAMLAPKISEHLKTNVGLVNCSVGGINTLEMMDIFRVIAPMVDSLSAIIFATGVNDIKHMGRDRSAPFYLDPKQHKSVWRDLFKLASDLQPSVPIFVVSVMPANQELYDAPNNGLSIYRCNQEIEDYNSKIRKVCSDMGVQFVNAAAQIKYADWVKTLIDGVHTNAVGHRFLADTVLNSLKLGLRCSIILFIFVFPILPLLFAR